MGRFTLASTLAALVIVLTGTLAGCQEAVKTYAMSPEAAKAALVGTTIPGVAFDRGAHSKPSTAASNRIVWVIRYGPNGADGLPPDPTSPVIGKLSATLTAAAGGTRVTVDLLPPDGADPAAFEDRKKSSVIFANLLQSAAREHVDATLTRRPFDYVSMRRSVPRPTSEQLRDDYQRTAREVEKYSRQDQSRIDAAYKNDRR